MAKQKATQDKGTVEMPPVDMPAIPPDSELTYIINDDSGEIREVVTRAGYAPAPMPFGFRLAKNNEVTGN